MLVVALRLHVWSHSSSISGQLSARGAVRPGGQKNNWACVCVSLKEGSVKGIKKSESGVGDFRSFVVEVVGSSKWLEHRAERKSFSQSGKTLKMRQDPGWKRYRTICL